MQALRACWEAACRRPGLGSCAVPGSDWRGWVVLYFAPYLTGAIGAGQPGDQMQCHVDPRGNAGRGHHVTVVDEALVAAHVDGRVEFAERVEPSPVSRGGAAAEHASGGVDQ